MKKLLALIFLLFSASCVFAQKADTMVNKLIKTKNVNGTTMSSSKDIMDNISAAPEFAVLTYAIKTAELTNSFKSAGPVTLFAPTAKAFAKLPAGQLDTLLLPQHKAELVRLLNYHAVAGKISSKDIINQIKSNNGQATYTTLSGGVLTARINENRNIVLTDENGGQSVVSIFDIQQSNGMLHVVTAVLTPKSKTM